MRSSFSAAVSRSAEPADERARRRDHLPLASGAVRDQLDEDTSPFNIAVGAAGVEDRKPGLAARNGQGGVRFSATTGRVDWSLSAYRGFEPFGLYELSAFGIPQRLYPRFTMIGGDFESVSGQWGVRGEVAAFVDDSFQSSDLRIVPGRSVDAGVGVDRRAGAYRISGSLLLHRESYDAPLLRNGASEAARDDVTFVFSADRSFSRERYQLRAFGVYGASAGSGFIRGIATAALRDNVALEGSAGWFAGGGPDLVGRFSSSDFVYARFKYYF